MFDWWRRLTGQTSQHVCDEFTQWETRERKHEICYLTRESRPEGSVLVGRVRDNPSMEIYLVRWQERRCTLCGKIQQANLER